MYTIAQRIRDRLLGPQFVLRYNTWYTQRTVFMGHYRQYDLYFEPVSCTALKADKDGILMHASTAAHKECFVRAKAQGLIP